VAPFGRGVDGGGISVNDGIALTLTNSTVANNTSSLTSTYPVGTPDNLYAGTGGIDTGNGPISIDGTRITGNTVFASDPTGDPFVGDAGMFAGTGTVSIHDTAVADNRVIADVATSTFGARGPVGGALEVDTSASLSRLRITGNRTTVTTHSGPVDVLGAFISEIWNAGPTPPADVMTDSVVSDNSTRVTAAGGPVNLIGAGVSSIAGPLELHDVQVSRNSASVVGVVGSLRGGGIYNGPGWPGDPDAHLVLDDVLVTRNALVASTPTIALQGGGVFSSLGVTQTATTIRGNAPDQCVGC
jgi:hypothetical protein